MTTVDSLIIVAAAILRGGELGAWERQMSESSREGPHYGVGMGGTLPALANLGSGELVFDSNPSHISGHPTVLAVLKEALLRIHSLSRERIYEEVEFGRVVGDSMCVDTSAHDVIIHAQRQNRNGLTRFVKFRPAEPCSTVVVILARETEEKYVLRTAFIGKMTPAEPWDEASTEDSISFWRSHALIWDEANIVPGTETSICPWE